MKVLESVFVFCFHIKGHSNYLMSSTTLFSKEKNSSSSVLTVIFFSEEVIDNVEYLSK